MFREPAMALPLRRLSCRLGPAGQKENLPAPLARQMKQARKRSRLELVERFPEVLTGTNFLPEEVLLAGCQRRHREPGFVGALERRLAGIRRRRQTRGIDAREETGRFARQRAMQICDGSV